MRLPCVLFLWALSIPYSLAGSRACGKGAISDRTPFRQKVGYMFNNVARLHSGIIQNEATAVFFDNIHYYWGKRQYDAVFRDKAEHVCVEKIFPNDTHFGHLRFPDGSPLTEIVYGCSNDLYCCDFDCCESKLAIIIIISLMFFICFMVIFCCPKRRGDPDPISQLRTDLAERIATARAAPPETPSVIMLRGMEPIPRPTFSSNCSSPDATSSVPSPVLLTPPTPRSQSTEQPPPSYDDVTARAVDIPPAYASVS